jgi:hypothetical protein
MLSGLRQAGPLQEATGTVGAKVYGRSKKHEILALFPVRYLSLEALDFGILDMDVVVDKARA